MFGHLTAYDDGSHSTVSWGPSVPHSGRVEGSSMRPRLAELDDSRFDVIVVGGGINGASTAQHLAAAGYRTLIVDKGDFGSEPPRVPAACCIAACDTRRPADPFSTSSAIRTRLAVALRMARLAMQARGEFVRTSPSRTTAMTLHFPDLSRRTVCGLADRRRLRASEATRGKEVPLDYRRMNPQQARAHRADRQIARSGSAGRCRGLP